MAIDRSQAEAIARDELAKLIAQSGIAMTLLTEETVTFDGGWAFSYQSTAYLETRDNRHRLLGNAPFVISSEDGSLLPSGTAHRIEDYIEHFKGRR